MQATLNGAIHEDSKDFFKMNKNEMIKVMETKTAQVPSHIYLGLAAGAIALSAGMFVLSRRKDIANFVGLWAPSLLLLGLYNKSMKSMEANLKRG